MDGLLNEKMKELLANPEAMAKAMDLAGKLFSDQGASSAPTLSGDSLAGIAKVLGGAAAASPAPAPAVSKQEPPAQASHTGGGEEDRIRLINALCPYLNPARREAAQALLRILKLVSMADAAGLFKRGI